MYIRDLPTYIGSILLRNHTWELHWYANDNDDNKGNNDNNNDGQQHTLNPYTYLICTTSFQMTFIFWSILSR